MAKKNGAEQRFVGIDIGGTKLHAVVSDGSGRVLGMARKKTRPERGFEGVMARAAAVGQLACVKAHVRPCDISAIGVGAPSPILADGTAVNAPNLGWQNEPLVTTLAEHFRQPIFAANDCDAGTFGEFTFGAARGARTAVGLFMGTGLGGGMVIDGALVRGQNQMAAEIGHMKVVVDGRRCGCGQLGCLEAYASKTGMLKRIACAVHCEGRETLLHELCEGDFSSIRSSVLAKAYGQGDAVAVESLEEAARYLGVGVANMITLLGPDVVVLGGGVFEALGAELIGLVRDTAAAQSFPPGSAKDTRIELAALGDDAVAVGAVALALREVEGA
ncbi:MAG: ROK family protein [Deltaproteobacteria bacterium]|nr:ROK family protein [Deltaproteobacteria bacterium]